MTQDDIPAVSLYIILTVMVVGILAAIWQTNASFNKMQNTTKEIHNGI